MRSLAVLLIVSLAACHADRLRPTDDGYTVSSKATEAEAWDIAVTVAEELGHYARERDGVIDVEIAPAVPMSERLSRWLHVTVDVYDEGTVTNVRVLPAADSAIARPRASRRHVAGAAYVYADLLAERLASVR